MSNTAIRLAFTAILLATALATAQQPRREQGNLIFDGIPSRDAALGEKLSRHLNSRGARFLDWLPDGGLLIATRFGDTEQVHRLGTPLGMREQLTFYPEPVTLAQAPQTAGADGFVFQLKDQLYHYRDADRSARLITDGKSQHGNPLWSHDGKRFAFYGTGRDGVSYDTYVAEAGSSAAPRLVHAAQRDIWYPLGWSPSDQKLLLLHYAPNDESDLSIVDAWSGIVTPLDIGDLKIGIRAARFAADGAGVLIASSADADSTQLNYLNPITHESRPLLPERAGDIAAFDMTADGRYLATVRDEDGRSRLNVLDTQTKLELAPPGAPDGRIERLRFDRTGKRLAFSAESAQSPQDVYVYDLTHNALERWTHSEVGAIDANRFITPERVRYPTWDRTDGRQRTFTAYVYRPRTPGPHPVLIHMPTGPQGQYQPGFEPFIQFLANELGIAVVAPNVRSAGGVQRGDAVKDIGSLLVWIGLQPAFDRERVTVMGEAQGGYLALASLAAYSDRLRGGVDAFGVDPIMQLKNIAAVRKPMLFVQGGAESQQMVSVLRGRSGEAWYLTAKDEAQRFAKKPNRDAYYETVAMFLTKLNAK